MVYLPRFPGIERLSPAALREFVRVADDLAISPGELAAVAYFESGFRSGARNPLSTATGLFQWTETTAKQFGTTTAELAEMSDAEQVTRQGQRLAVWRGKLKQLGDVLIANWRPIGLGKPDAYVHAAAGSEIYENHRALDLDADGKITNHDLRVRVLGALAAYPAVVAVPQAADVARTVGAHALLLGLVALVAWRASRRSP